ncbi:myeloid-associated differentiation marker-like [Stegastes partitus]|uniref:Myeloid-associated differentiation marker-like n=1 Tax=Stegastes partitus TaxID=144197 RepID=A0A3B5A073_9TELE|nr:PREDICTED: myeloid-associated differentiation marker-like [Stegastes partitus]
MPVIVLEARDFTSPLFLVRTLEVLLSCTAFSLVASLEHEESNTFWIFCMFTWCFFFTLTLLIHILSIIQFHSLIPISWKNLTMTVAVLGALMSLSTSVLFPCNVMDHKNFLPHSVAAAVASCLTTLAYTSESFVLRTQAQEQRGYMGSLPGLLKIVQLWGGCQIITLLVENSYKLHDDSHEWKLWVSGVTCGVCLFMSVVTLMVILGDFAGRCLLPFDRLLAGFSLIGVLLYMLATVICLTKILHLRGHGQNEDTKHTGLVILETVVSSITLLAYTVDLAFSIKQLCDRSHM